MKPQSFDPNACGLKKRNYSRKVISELEDDQGEITKEEEQILLKIENYYRDLYTSKMDVTEEQFDHYIEHLEVPCLSQEVSEKAEGRLTYAKCKESLDSFSSGKSPGEDGFTVEFYSKFFYLIGNDLVESLNATYENEQLSISQRRGIQL